MSRRVYTYRHKPLTERRYRREHHYLKEERCHFVEINVADVYYTVDRIAYEYRDIERCRRGNTSENKREYYSRAVIFGI